MAYYDAASADIFGKNTPDFGGMMKNLSTRLTTQLGQRGAAETMKILTETDPAKLDRLYSALARVEEMDRRLTNRSLPPTLRANDKRGSGRRHTPQPVVSSVARPGPVPPSTTPPVQVPQG